MRALRLWAVMATWAMVVFGIAACSPAFPLSPDQALDASTIKQELADQDYEAHLQALQDIADANDGNRAAGTSGYEESAQYVEEVLREAGYEPVRQPFTFRKGRDDEEVQSFNILADTGGNEKHTIVVGGHLDSVDEGPGINDNGSGIAAMLEVARWIAASDTPPANRVRFAFWGAEEQGLEGSDHYVDELSGSERDQTALNLNVDMAASPNGGRFVHDGDGSDFGDDLPEGSAQIERVFLEYFSAVGQDVEPTFFDGGSDYAAFEEEGIPVGGLFSGDVGVKTPAEVEAFGGEAGSAHDPCYHRNCDTIDNVDLDLLADMAGALAYATWAFAVASPADD
ncbi:M20/M25/M40 family metallo-hydrolase [Arthrobacter sp. JZ12]|uniref:M20/M25/M40 family metallo-hydrolase n=1 Tax=Arthrobacter sp. JZ12 TaxID=2654190 RepID=UPI002B4716D6|nr:M20/M25/M40 family metallo-hydrolase [Arthrobacter sp. JZ12]WRH25976.1 M20/M25/M40 family metallo-hydrolase [Arthrobacter sp. JZ12]